MRTIDADELKKQFSTDEPYGAGEISIIIDKAPTVEITEKQAILLLINSGWLVNHDKELREKWERPQGDLISREELKKVIEKYRPTSSVKSTFVDGRHSMFMDCIIEIDKAPTVVVDNCGKCPYYGDDDRSIVEEAFNDGYNTAREKFERPKGKWVKSKDGYTRCDQCGSRGSAIKARFCHHCGADMRGKEV